MPLRYYLPEADPGVLKKWLARPVSHFPETVLLETRSGCNGLCIFCPYEKVKDTLPKGEMEQNIFEKVVAELRLHGAKNLIPCFLNEPLLDPHLTEKLRYVREQVPDIRINLTTNASLLTEEKTAELVDHTLVDEITISFQGISKEVYEQSMPGLSYSKTRKNVEYLIDYVRQSARNGLRIIVAVVRTTIVVPEIREAVVYWKKRGVKARIMDYENRSGEVDDRIAAGKPSAYDACKRPFNTAVITFDGKVVLCCVDYKRKMVVGDLKSDSLYNIWNGTEFNEIRRLILASKRCDVPACRNCRIWT